MIKYLGTNLMNNIQDIHIEIIQITEIKEDKEIERHTNFMNKTMLYTVKVAIPQVYLQSIKSQTHSKLFWGRK